MGISNERWDTLLKNALQSETKVEKLPERVLINLYDDKWMDINTMEIFFTKDIKKELHI